MSDSSVVSRLVLRTDEVEVGRSCLDMLPQFKPGGDFTPSDAGISEK
jgi:hypothetical protein